MQPRIRRTRAFTLIELLVVIVIIGLLTGLASASYINAQKIARDNSRKAGVASVAAAVETYYQAKRTFPGLIGNEGVGNVPTTSGYASWEGCLAIDNSSGYQSIAYYSYPTDPAATTVPTIPCNNTAVRTKVAGFDPAQYAPYPNWIPGLGEYLNPVPVDHRYQNSSGAVAPLDDPNGVGWTAARDVLGANNSAYSYVYRRLVGGYMVYAKLESSTTDTPVGTFTDTPKYAGSGGPDVGVTVSNSNVFMIRK